MADEKTFPMESIVWAMAAQVATVAAVITLSLWLMIIFIIGSMAMNGNPTGTMRQLLDGTAAKTSVYRVLVPITVNTIITATPEALEKRGTEFLLTLRNSELGRHIISKRHGQHMPDSLTPENVFDFAVVMLVVWLTCLLYAWALHLLAKALWPEQIFSHCAAPLIGLVAIPPFMITHAYPFDFAEMWLCTLCMLFMYQRRWPAYLLTLALATLNKETAIFMCFFYFIWGWFNVRRPEYWRYGLAQLAVYIVIKASINWYFMANGDSTGSGWGYKNLLATLDAYTHHAALLFVLGGMILSLRWHEKPLFLRYGLVMLIPNTIAYIFFCTPGEYRSFYFSLPVLVLLATHSFAVLVEGRRAWKGENIPSLLP